jgi:predicted ATP-dependent serine protease
MQGPEDRFGGKESNGFEHVSPLVRRLRERAEQEAAHELNQPEEEVCSKRSSNVKTYCPSWRSAVQLLNEPDEDIEYLVPGLIPSGAVILLSGREGTLKSFLVLQLSNEIAKGGAWLGKQCLKGPVLYIDAEMPRKLVKKRLRVLKPCEDLHIWHHGQDGFPFSLKDPRLIEEAKHHRVMIIDPLKRFMNGLEENSSTAMAEVTADLRNLATKTECTVIAIHHSPKQVERLATEVPLS